MGKKQRLGREGKVSMGKERGEEEKRGEESTKAGREKRW